jgi:chemotaxis protein MotA
MEKSTIVGLGLGLFALIAGMMLKGANPMGILQNPAALTIILIGTAASVTIAFPGYELKKIPRLLKLVFVPQKLMPKTEVIRLFMEWATITRREGLLALESHVEEIDDPFLKNGMRMIIDGNDQEFVRDVLMEELHATEERHKVGAAIFTQAGTYAPTLGVLGAVIGLVAALSSMQDTEQLAHSISAAFIATLLGIFTGYVLWHPIANKLRRLSRREIELKLMMVEGLLSIQSGVSTMAIQQKLSVYLSPSERAEEERKRGEALNAEKAQPV